MAAHMVIERAPEGAEAGDIGGTVFAIHGPGAGLVVETIKKAEHTDGVSEAFNPQRELYGNERLLRDIASSTDKGASVVVTEMLQRVRGFADGAPQSDDIAVLALHLADSASGAPS